MKKIPFLLLIAAVLIIARIAVLPFSPPGFFLDEAASGAHAVSMLRSGTNAHDVMWPLFSESLGGGYTTPVYLYPLTGWIAVFGPSELALRYFSVIMTILAILLVGYVLKLWLGKREALVGIIAGLALPWGWLQGSLAWDPALVPFLLALALLSFTLLLRPTSRADKIAAFIALPISLVGLAYLYPPMRVTAPLLFLAAYIVLWRQKIIGIRGLFVTVLGSIIIALPLAKFMFTPEALGRSQALSVFHDTSIIGGLWLAFTNFLQLINPVFLFATGDPNLRHSTGFEGMLGIAAIPPLVALCVILFLRIKHHKLPKAFDRSSLSLVWIGLFGSCAGLLGSVLTNEGQPHSLRATAVWMFVLLLITVGWKVLLSSWITKRIKIACITLCVIATAGYMIDLVLFYPARSSGSFDTAQRSAIFDGQTDPAYPELARRYYQIR